MRQGCPLSPTLFILYINDLVPFIEERCSGTLIYEERANGLLFADDAALLTEDLDSMQLTLKVLEEYCLKWDLKVNVMTKTKVMRSPWSLQDALYYGNVRIDDVTSFKYLGFIKSNTGDRSLGM